MFPEGTGVWWRATRQRLAQGIWEVATVVTWLQVLCGLCSPSGTPQLHAASSELSFE